MDDFIMIAKTRWSLSHSVNQLNQFFNKYSFKQHPDKTFIGKVFKGFNWLGEQAFDGISLSYQDNYVELCRQRSGQTQHRDKNMQQKHVTKYRKQKLSWIYMVAAISLWGCSLFAHSAAFAPGRNAHLINPYGTTPISMSPSCAGSTCASNISSNWTYLLACFRDSPTAMLPVNSAGACPSVPNWHYTPTAIQITPSAAIPARSFYQQVSTGIYVYVGGFKILNSYFLVYTGDPAHNICSPAWSIPTYALDMNVPFPQTYTAPGSPAGSVVITSNPTGSSAVNSGYPPTGLSNICTNPPSISAMSNGIIVTSSATGGVHYASGLYVTVMGAIWQLVEPTSIHVAPSCTSVIPSTLNIPFGTVNNKSTGTVLSTWGSFNPGVTCDSDARATPVVYRFTASTVDANGNLTLTTAGGLPVGAVSISKDTGSSNSCLSSASKIKWNAPSSSMYTPSTGIHWWDNFYFQLCSDGASTTGLVSGTGTFDIWYP